MSPFIAAGFYLVIIGWPHTGSKPPMIIPMSSEFACQSERDRLRREAGSMFPPDLIQCIKTGMKADQ